MVIQILEVHVYLNKLLIDLIKGYYINNNSINDYNYCKLKEEVENNTSYLPILEQEENDIESESLPIAKISVKDIMKIYIKYLKVHLLPRSFSISRKKAGINLLFNEIHK